MASWSTTLTLSGLGGDDGGAVLTAVVGNFRPFVGTILDDEADTPITAGEGPFTGRFIPVEPLSLFDGQSVFGSWTLEIEDTATGDEGELTGWKLIVNDPEDVPADFQYSSNIGNDSPSAENDVDLYQVELMSAGKIRIDVQPSSTLDSVIRLFDASGNELDMANTSGLGTVDSLAVSVPAAGSYLIGISSDANVTYSPLDGSGAAGGTSSGSYQLLLRFDQALDNNDDNSSFDTATDFGVLGQAGQNVFAEIRNPPLLLNMPGSILEPGHRDIPPESHYGGGAVTGNSITTAYYNFQDFYGVLPTGDIPQNVITENQKDRAREVFEIYGDLLGIKFVETEDQGLTVVTGDLRALDPAIPTGPGGVAGLSDGSLGGMVIMDAAEDWGISEYGGSWFQTAMHEIGHSLGLGHTYDLPSLTIMGDNTIPGAPAAEPVFPGDGDIIHGQFLFPPAADDIDLYRFEVTEPGRADGRNHRGTDGPQQQPARCHVDSLSGNGWSGWCNARGHRPQR